MGLQVEQTSSGFRLSPVRRLDRSGAARLDFISAGWLESDLPMVAVRIHGRRVLALVDTGADQSVVDPRVAFRLGIVPLRKPGATESATEHSLWMANGRGLGQTFSCVIGLARDLQLGEISLSQIPLGILDRPLTPNGWMAGHRVEMILGSDILRTLDPVSFDFPSKTLHLRPASDTPATTSLTSAIRIDLIGKESIPRVRSRIEGMGECTVGIDTGGDFALWIPPEWMHSVPVTQMHTLPFPRHGTGAGGTTASLFVGNRSLTLGGVEFDSVSTEVGLHQPPGAPPIPFALLGRAFLKRYRVTFQWDQNTLLLERTEPHESSL